MAETGHPVAETGHPVAVMAEAVMAEAGHPVAVRRHLVRMGQPGPLGLFELEYIRAFHLFEVPFPYPYWDLFGSHRI